MSSPTSKTEQQDNRSVYKPTHEEQTSSPSLPKEDQKPSQQQVCVLLDPPNQETLPLMDLTSNKDEPFVIAKLPFDLYQKLQNDKMKPREEENRNEREGKEYHIKGSWTEEEDKKLIELVRKHGPKRWSFIASKLPGRIGKQCRERYLNHLDPSINKNPWTPEEDQIIIEMHAKYGNQWAKMSRVLQGRTANAIKNHWNSTLSRKLEKVKRHFTNVPSQVNSPQRQLTMQCNDFFTSTNFLASQKKRQLDQSSDLLSKKPKMDIGIQSMQRRLSPDISQITQNMPPPPIQQPIQQQMHQQMHQQMQIPPNVNVGMQKLQMQSESNKLPSHQDDKMFNPFNQSYIQTPEWAGIMTPSSPDKIKMSTVLQGTTQHSQQQQPIDQQKSFFNIPMNEGIGINLMQIDDFKGNNPQDNFSFFPSNFIFTTPKGNPNKNDKSKNSFVSM